MSSDREWWLSLASEIKANAEDHPNETMSRFALHWADQIAARAIAAAPAIGEVIESEANGNALTLYGGWSDTLDALPVGTKLYAATTTQDPQK